MDKIGETLGAGKSSCHKQGWGKSWCKTCLARTPERLWGTLEVGETYQVMEVASSSRTI